MAPLVTVVCVCYNHSRFVVETLQSVWNQKGIEFELIICDDFSTDSSAEIIKEWAKDKEGVKLILNDANEGNCRLFNKALKIATGKYIVDLAADDILLESYLQKRVQHFEQLSDSVALTFSDAYYINERGDHLFKFSKLIDSEFPPEGDVFNRLFQGRFICPPSTMFRTLSIKNMGGYDETLSYEDFDIWMRLARDHEFRYFNEVTVSKRIVKGSSSSFFYKVDIKYNHLASTFEICKKAIQLAKNDEKEAIGSFIWYHFRLAYYTFQTELAYKFYNLAKEYLKPTVHSRILKFLLDKRINIYLLYRLYIKFRIKDSKL